MEDGALMLCVTESRRLCLWPRCVCPAQQCWQDVWCLPALRFVPVLSHREPGAAATGAHGVHRASLAGGARRLPVLCLQGRAVHLWPKPSGQGCHLQIRPFLRPLHGSQREVGGGKSWCCVHLFFPWFARAGVPLSLLVLPKSFLVLLCVAPVCELFCVIAVLPALCWALFLPANSILYLQ